MYAYRANGSKPAVDVYNTSFGPLGELKSGLGGEICLFCNHVRH